ncbi:MAG TPA: TIGR04282 family arsenosugar biosynthesis glycosyltransferase [Ktedonobacteraceae bacterium]
MSDTALLIMTRYPEKGKVKTRLARSIGDEATLQVYQAFLIDLALRFKEIASDLYWVYTPAMPGFHAALAELIAPVRLPGSSFPQQGVDLGERLLEAFRTIHAQGYRAAVLIGSDSPHISEDTILQAMQAMEHADVVLGPSVDGGYYLIAMRQPHDVFTDIPMSTDAVLRLTVKKAQEQGLRVQLLETLLDIDEHADLLTLAQMLEEEPDLAPMTAACLAQIKKEF